MTEQLIAPVIPPAPVPARRGPGRAGAGGPLPLDGPAFPSRWTRSTG
jgi:hypothetical protein